MRRLSALARARAREREREGAAAARSRRRGRLPPGGWCRDGRGSGGRRRDRRRCRRHWLGIRLRRPVDEPERVSWHCWSSTTGGSPTSTWTLNGPGEVWGLGSSTSQRSSTPTASICGLSKATSELGTSMSGMGSRRWRPRTVSTRKEPPTSTTTGTADSWRSEFRHAHRTRAITTHL
jgi:hypothetical protein